MRMKGSNRSLGTNVISPSWLRKFVFLLWIVLSFPGISFADRASDVLDSTVSEQVGAFFDFPPYVRRQLVGCMLMGACCGLLGSFIVARRMALVGDMLSHAVLPGVVLGFLWNFKKDPVALLIGAIIAGLLAAVFVTSLQRTTKLKQDSALAITLGGFYAVGICLLSYVQRQPQGDKSGLSHILMGQAAALSDADLKLILVVTIASIIIIGALFKEFLASSFDPGFARSVGIPERGMHYLLMALLSFAVVISIQAVGVVLVSALLIIPAATASLLTHRMWLVILLAMGLGMASAFGGAFVSFLQSSFATGPVMILVGVAFFGFAFLFSPWHGLVPRLVRRRSQAARIQRENTLKAIFHQLEAEGFTSERVDIADIVNRRRRSREEIGRELANLARYDLIDLDDESFRLTETGWRRAREIVRNHRLWELYLTHSADIAPDHVHDDAEKIEHVLGEEVVRILEARFGEEALDPHGKLIPAAGKS